MGETVTAKSKVYIGGVFTGNPTIADFTAQTWTEIGNVSDLGSWGPKGNEVTATVISDGYTRRLKGTIDSGTVELVVLRDTLDEGQNLAREAAQVWTTYLFKVELNDKPTVDGTNTFYYFRASVMSAENEFSDADNIIKTTLSLGITGQLFEVPAAPVVTISPAPGALAGGTEATPYTASVTATGGIGAVSYAITAGALPAGLTLNAATGEISGTPTADGNSTFTVTATYTGSGTASGVYTLAIV